MIPKDSPENGRAYSPAYKALALVAILVLFLGGGWASLSPGGGAEAGIGRTGMRLARMNLALPEPRRILGMLALDRDIDDFLEYADRNDAGGSYYRDEARIALEMRPLRARYEAAFASAYAALSGKASPDAASVGERLGATGRKAPYIASPDDVWLPPRSELRLSHPYALDVFFQSVERSGEAERGPVIRALYPGIVVAAAGDWSGGQGISTWRGGGLSPAAGNGLVIYDPASRRYCSYFHLSSLALFGAAGL